VISEELLLIDVQSSAVFEVRVSTTGLLLRSKPAPASR
jgi:hypothetical protein